MCIKTLFTKSVDTKTQTCALLVEATPQYHRLAVAGNHPVAGIRPEGILAAGIHLEGILAVGSHLVVGNLLAS